MTTVVEEYEYETDSGSDSDSDGEYEEVVEEEVVEVKKPSKNAPQKAAVPCKNYRVDTTADKFGTCKCGWDKTAHETKGENKAAQALSRLRSGKGNDGAFSSGDGPCQNFRVDVTADKFGMCKCGYHQSEHKEKADNPARRALQSLRSTSSSKPMTPDGKPCHNYVADVKADRFGMCVCGFHKSEHGEKQEDAAAAMLRNLHERNKAHNDEADRAALGIKDAGNSGPQASNGAAPSGGGCCVVM
ncbi:Hypothetical Protein FCC1311_013342 [Hondaea fermentalgiana]|uniref:Uncharacterized protein n=1 Tax=Hondaea fermentalgiana TaxID=2315210 RepID=A0A2R5G278_9STRA|nr:Hypothetical Protein FCC1311_013342 [Hondaea fermentalgiana]|eukprot:GBG25116.1 Hypothetical Protein FCC1311_013342 [Hondaea fermentalgiana]